MSRHSFQYSVFSIQFLIFFLSSKWKMIFFCCLFCFVFFFFIFFCVRLSVFLDFLDITILIFRSSVYDLILAQKYLFRFMCHILIIYNWFHMKNTNIGSLFGAWKFIGTMKKPFYLFQMFSTQNNNFFSRIWSTKRTFWVRKTEKQKKNLHSNAFMSSVQFSIWLNFSKSPHKLHLYIRFVTALIKIWKRRKFYENDFLLDE